jgi:hypothetical protein
MIEINVRAYGDKKKKKNDILAINTTVVGIVCTIMCASIVGS